MNTDLMFSSKTDLWSTPQNFFDELNREFSFQVDVCADKSNAKCPIYYTKEDDGLNKNWGGVCWMNPPYGKEIGKWVEKAYKESRMDKTIVVALLPARTDTRYFHDFIYGKAEIRFIKGRLKFGNAKTGAPFPSMIVVFKTDKQPA